jgi:hypothetical protein
MKKEKKFIDYGIYIDHKQSFIVSLNNVLCEEFMNEETKTNEVDASGSSDAGRQQHIQNKTNEQLKKFCKSIIAKLERAHRILIFGPSRTKFELQKEIKNTKSLMHVSEELLVTDKMKKDEALRFVNNHFIPIAAD